MSCLLNAQGFGRVLYVDIDTHHGDGVEEATMTFTSCIINRVLPSQRTGVWACAYVDIDTHHGEGVEEATMTFTSCIINRVLRSQRTGVWACAVRGHRHPPWGWCGGSLLPHRPCYDGACRTLMLRFRELTILFTFASVQRL